MVTTLSFDKFVQTPFKVVIHFKARSDSLQSAAKAQWTFLQSFIAIAHNSIGSLNKPLMVQV